MTDPTQGIGRASQVMQGACGAAGSSLDKLDIKRDDPGHIHPAIVFASIFELAFGISVLASRTALVGIPVLLRSALEAYADFLIVVRDTDNYHYLHSAYVSEQSRFLKAAESAQELRQVRELPEFDARREAVARELQDYKDKGYAPLNVEQKFDRAELPGMYRSTYWYLCTEAHSNLMSLSKRHIRGTKEIEGIEVFSPAYHQAALEHLCVAIALLIEATERFQVHFKIEDRHGLDKVASDFAALQREYPPRE